MTFAYTDVVRIPHPASPGETHPHLNWAASGARWGRPLPNFRVFGTDRLSALKVPSRLLAWLSHSHSLFQISCLMNRCSLPYISWSFHYSWDHVIMFTFFSYFIIDEYIHWFMCLLFALVTRLPAQRAQIYFSPALNTVTDT